MLLSLSCLCRSNLRTAPPLLSAFDAALLNQAAYAQLCCATIGGIEGSPSCIWKRAMS